MDSFGYDPRNTQVRSNMCRIGDCKELGAFTGVRRVCV